MHRVLLDLGFLRIYSYGACAAAGFLLGLMVFVRSGRRDGFAEQELYLLALGTILGGLVGARLLYIVNHWTYFARFPARVLQLWRGGLVFYGGLVVGLAVLIAMSRRRQIPFLRVADLIAPAVCLGLAVGRVGCFLNGCCYGRPWAWGVVFPPDSAAGQAFPGQRLIPVQLISSASLVVLYLVTRMVGGRSTRAGQSMAVFLVLYGLYRFSIQFLRGDYPQVAFGLSEPQWVSLGVGIAGAILWYGIKTRPDAYGGVRGEMGTHGK